MTRPPQPTAREAQIDEHPQVLAIMGEIFPPLPLESWREDAKRTASVGFVNGEMVGAMGLHPRRIRLAPGVVVDAALEHDVGVHESHRGRGVGEAMIGAARQFLLDRCDFLMVWRGDESSAAYRFYRDKTHHAILSQCFQPRLNRPPGDDLPLDAVREVPVDKLTAREHVFLEVFRACYRDRGGFIEREAGYYGKQMRDLSWVSIPTEFRLLVAERDGELIGYRAMRDEMRR